MGNVSSEYSILAVEDNKHIASALRAFFSCENMRPNADVQFKLDHVLSSEEALIRLRSNLIPDLIITDLGMAGMDGATFLQKLRDNSEHKNIPVIIFSGSKDLKSIAAKLNISYCIDKADINFDEMLRILRLALGIP